MSHHLMERMILPPQEPSFSKPQSIKRDNVISEELLAVIDEQELEGILGSPLSETTPGDLPEKQFDDDLLSLIMTNDHSIGADAEMAGRDSVFLLDHRLEGPYLSSDSSEFTSIDSAVHTTNGTSTSNSAVTKEIQAKNLEVEQFNKSSDNLAIPTRVKNIVDPAKISKLDELRRSSQEFQLINPAPEDIAFINDGQYSISNFVPFTSSILRDASY